MNGILKEILTITEEIQNAFPACYNLLDETPLFLSSSEEGVGIYDFERYLETITIQLGTFRLFGLPQKQ